MEAERPVVQDHPWLSSEFETNLGYMRPCLKKNEKWQKVGGSGEMVQWLRARAALAEDLSSVPSTHMVVHNFQLQRVQQPLWPPWVSTHMYTYT